MMPKETKNLLGATCPSMLSPSWVITVDVFTSKQTQKRNFVHIHCPIVMSFWVKGASWDGVGLPDELI